MDMTGGLPVRREVLGVSAGVGSSGQTSALSSDISTNSSAKIFRTTFGGSAAAGLKGPGACSCAAASVARRPARDVPAGS